MKRVLLNASLTLSFFFAAGHSVTGLAAASKPPITCTQNNQVETRLVQHLQQTGALHSYQLKDVILPIVIGQPSEPTAAPILWMRHAGKWRQYQLAAGHNLMGVYSTPAYDRVMLFSMWTQEGPGNSYEIIHLKNQLAKLACTSLAFPTELNHPQWANEYLALQDFNLDQRGRGALLGSSEHELANGKTVQHWYRYTTQDWGKSWSKPVRIPHPTQPFPGIFTAAIEVKPSATLLVDLLKSH